MRSELTETRFFLSVVSVLDCTFLRAFVTCSLCLNSRFVFVFVYFDWLVTLKGTFSVASTRVGSVVTSKSPERQCLVVHVKHTITFNDVIF